MKKFINDPKRVVPEMIEGMLAVHSHLAKLDNYNVRGLLDILCSHLAIPRCLLQRLGRDYLEGA